MSQAAHIFRTTRTILPITSASPFLKYSRWWTPPIGFLLAAIHDGEQAAGFIARSMAAFE
jgi:hypothetical protein